MNQFNKGNFKDLCEILADRDQVFKAIMLEYGYPPMWTRPNTFETLVLTVLEQQVSLASAYAAYKKLKEKIGEITPENVLSLDDAGLRSCYFSRQKIVYVRELAGAILNMQIELNKLALEDDDTVRRTLKKLKGIGDWTVDIYLLHALQRTNIFPTGDLALVNAIRMLKAIEKPTKTELVQMAAPWEPYRSIATMMLWHYYIKKKNIIIQQ